MTRTIGSLQARRIRALVLAEDDAVVRALRRSLEARRCSVVSAPDGARGLSVLLDELLRLDVLVVDLNLPGRGARALVDVIRRAGGERDLSIVVLATAAGEGLRGELLALGADAVVDRSAGPDAVARAVQVAVARRSGSDVSPRPPAPAGRAPRWGLRLPWSPQPA